MSQNVQRFRLVTPQDRPLQLALDAFLIAQEAARHSPLTVKWYEQRLGAFVAYLAERGVAAPEGVTATHCRAFLVGLGQRRLKDTTVHGHAQVLKTFCRFLEREGFARPTPCSPWPCPRWASASCRPSRPTT